MSDEKHEGRFEHLREKAHAERHEHEVEESVEADLPPTELSVEEDAAREAARER